MKVISLTVILIVLSTANADSFIDFLNSSRLTNIPAGYHVESQHHDPNPYTFFTASSHQYTLMVNGKTCELDVGIVVSQIIGTLPQYNILKDTCSVAA